MKTVSQMMFLPILPFTSCAPWVARYSVNSPGASFSASTVSSSSWRAIFRVMPSFCSRLRGPGWMIVIFAICLLEEGRLCWQPALLHLWEWLSAEKLLHGITPCDGCGLDACRPAGYCSQCHPGVLSVVSPHLLTCSFADGCVGSLDLLLVALWLSPARLEMAESHRDLFRKGSSDPYVCVFATTIPHRITAVPTACAGAKSSITCLLRADILVSQTLLPLICHASRPGSLCPILGDGACGAISSLLYAGDQMLPVSDARPTLIILRCSPCVCGCASPAQLPAFSCCCSGCQVVVLFPACSGLD